MGKFFNANEMMWSTGDFSGQIIWQRPSTRNRRYCRYHVFLQQKHADEIAMHLVHSKFPRKFMGGAKIHEFSEMGVSENFWYPKIDGENNGKTLLIHGWFGGTTIFGNIQMCLEFSCLLLIWWPSCIHWCDVISSIGKHQERFGEKRLSTKRAKANWSVQIFEVPSE